MFATMTPWTSEGWARLRVPEPQRRLRHQREPDPVQPTDTTARPSWSGAQHPLRELHRDHPGHDPRIVVGVAASPRTGSCAHHVAYVELMRNTAPRPARADLLRGPAAASVRGQTLTLPGSSSTSAASSCPDATERRLPDLAASPPWGSASSRGAGRVESARGCGRPCGLRAAGCSHCSRSRGRLSWPPMAFDCRPGALHFVGGCRCRPSYCAARGLVLYTAAFIGEVVRAGSRGSTRQLEAARALGLGRHAALDVFPQALRIIVPPLTSRT